ncbi:unnamed protein product [Heligmosomoides polygyrus]|uniref:MULE domain-containing protein n=1 Tax=Heligmosomoides polygyrus TaxID=6339 RepID=A0A183FFE3_HELPZ|nr:unnamed protein product [Heligmosomoides polygyrus]
MRNNRLTRLDGQLRRVPRRRRLRGKGSPGEKVKRDIEFERDPAGIGHVCVPIMWVKEKTKRVFYEKLQEWRNEDAQHNSTAKEEYRKLLDNVNNSRTLTREEKDEILIFLHNYERRRCTIGSVASRGVTVTMENIPKSLALHANGELFLQKRTSTMHIYYTQEIIELACRNGLGALVGDGMFSMHPCTKEKNGQLYTIHGVCEGKVHVPLLYAITNSKTYSTYAAIYGELKGALARVPGRHHLELRIILDYERAAIKAARRAFPRATIEGCAFHLARAWNRRGDQETWLRGPFAGIWNKWNVKTLRTSNIAGTFHSNLLAEVKKKRPPLETLVKVLKSMTAQSKAKLLHHQRHPYAPEPLRERDKRR